jgi:ABC-type sugar transport system ATPase subunit
VLALLGENGAGKSTLIKVLGGAYTADSGDILLEGQIKQLYSPAEARRNGISIIYQEFKDCEIIVPETYHHLCIHYKRHCSRHSREHSGLTT